MVLVDGSACVAGGDIREADDAPTGSSNQSVGMLGVSLLIDAFFFLFDLVLEPGLALGADLRILGGG